MGFGDLRYRTMWLLVAIAIVAVLMHSSPAAAAETAVGGGAILQSFVGLLVVIAVIFALAWLARARGGFAQGGSVLKAVASLSVGPRERVVIVELRETWLVLGVGPGRVTTLTTLPRPAAAASDAAPQPPASLFADLLARAGFKNQGGGTDGGTRDGA